VSRGQWLAFVVAIVGLLAQTIGAQTPAPSVWPLLDVTTAGSTRHAAADVLRWSGLSIGRPTSLADLEAAADRLSRTGLFKEIRYRYKTSTKGVSVTYQGEDAAWTAPIAFDNFIWFADDELMAAIRATIPGFDGRVSEEGRGNEFVSSILEKTLASKEIRARVTTQLLRDLATDENVFTFKVVDAPVDLTVCALRVSGATALPISELLAAAPDLIGQPYSKGYATGLAAGTFTTLYQRKGYWDTKFSAPMPTVAGGCTGVSISIDLVEGGVFKWASVRWAGATALGEATLNTALNLTPDGLADVRWLEEGLRNVGAAYGHAGYLTESHSYVAELDRAALRVGFNIVVKEGPQFRMGALAVTGTGERAASRLRDGWRLKAGEVFDLTEYKRFLAVMSGLAPAGTKVTPDIQLDTAAKVANLTLVVSERNAPERR
jgi:outer membrane protein assembly factor BamA